MSEIKTFIDVFHTMIEIVCLVVPAISTFLVRERKKWLQNHPKNPFSRTSDWVLIFLYASILVFLILFVVVLVMVNFFPGFVITSPHSGQMVVSDSREIEVSGIGAYPGNNVVVFVSDGHTQFKQIGMGIPSKAGNWAVENVVLQTPGYEYSIWAETEYNGVPVLTNNRITASRVDKSHSWMAFIQNNIPYFLIIIFVGGIYFVWKRWGRKMMR